MRNRISAAFAIAICWTVIACQATVTGTPNGPVSRYYILTSLDGAHLPVTLSSDAISAQEVVGGSITLEDTVYTRTVTYRTTFAASQQKNPVNVNYSESGLFTLGDTKIFFEPQSADAAPFNWTAEGELKPSIISISMGGHLYGFQIQ